MTCLLMAPSGTSRTVVEEGEGFLLMKQCGNVGTVARKVAVLENVSNPRTKNVSRKIRPSGWENRRMLINLGLKEGPAVQVVPTATNQAWTTSGSSGSNKA